MYESTTALQYFNKINFIEFSYLITTRGSAEEARFFLYKLKM